MTSNESTNFFSMTPETEDCQFSLHISERACQKIQQLAAQEQHMDPQCQPYLHIEVEGGGCSGFQYIINLATTQCAYHLYFKAQDVCVGLDAVSLELVSGATIDYEQDMMSASFVIKNPNATVSCGCGNSFSVM